MGYVDGLSVRVMRGSDTHHAMRGWPRTPDVETGFQLRSHSPQRLNTSQGTGSGTASACPAMEMVIADVLET
jgi:hypothetical protein